MSSQTLFASMKERLAMRAGWDRTTANWSTDRSNLFEVLKKDALSRFENAYNWSFLYRQATLELTPAYSTGTIAIASGVVTLADGTFPSWAAQGDLWVVDGDETQRYSVNTLDNSPTNTQITLDDTSVAVDAGTTYTLNRHFYDMPADFGGTFDRGFAFRRDSAYAGLAIKKVSPVEFQTLDDGTTTGRPCYFMLQAVPVTATASTSWRVAFTPLPGETMFLDYRYKLVPADVDTTNDFPYGGAMHSETILASLDYSWALHAHWSNSEEYYAIFMRRLADSKRNDNYHRPIDYGPVMRGNEYYDGTEYWDSSIDDATLFTS